jgi:predicted phage terminase large subunit-like protein
VIQLHRAQYDFVASKSPFIAYVGGYSSGKTQALCLRLLDRLSHNLTLAYYMPTYALIRELGIPRLVSLLEEHYPGIRCKVNLQTWTVTVPGFGRVIYRSMDAPESIIGYEVADSFFDELDTLPIRKATEIWQKGMGRNRQPRPDRRKNTMSVATTPEGFNFVYENWGKEPRPGYELIRSRTLDNPWADLEYIDNLKENYPSHLMEAYLNGEFVDMHAAMFQRSWIKTGEPPVRLPRIMGVDLAISIKETADFSSVAVFSRDTQGNVYVEYVERFQQPFNKVVDRIKAIAAEWNPVLIAIEQVQYQAAVVQELLRTTTLPVRGVRPEKDKLTRFQPLMARYEQGLVYHSPTLPREFADELAAFPGGKHDDMVDAAALAFNNLGETGPRCYGVIKRTF